MVATRPKPLVAGNWKMNGLQPNIAEIDAMGEGYDAALKARCDLLVCPPATILYMAAAAAHAHGIAVGGQDCHVKSSGAHTGDIAAEMLRGVGATFCIVGHSERRADHDETSAMVKAKAEAAIRAGMVAIVCVGETKDERVGGKTLAVVGGQVRESLPDGATPANTVIAYEPVWAIGTGLTPTTDDVAEVHTDIRQTLGDVLSTRNSPDVDVGAAFRILYGGSVKPDNAGILMAIPNVDGALVGGASLKAADFLAIAAAYR